MIPTVKRRFPDFFCGLDSAEDLGSIARDLEPVGGRVVYQTV
jgi:hypothetical protein